MLILTAADLSTSPCNLCNMSCWHSGYSAKVSFSHVSSSYLNINYYVSNAASGKQSLIPFMSVSEGIGQRRSVHTRDTALSGRVDVEVNYLFQIYFLYLAHIFSFVCLRVLCL